MSLVGWKKKYPCQAVDDWSAFRLQRLEAGRPHFCSSWLKWWSSNGDGCLTDQAFTHRGTFGSHFLDRGSGTILSDKLPILADSCQFLQILAEKIKLPPWMILLPIFKNINHWPFWKLHYVCISIYHNFRKMCMKGPNLAISLRMFAWGWLLLGTNNSPPAKLPTPPDDFEKIIHQIRGVGSLLLALRSLVGRVMTHSR